MVRDEITNTALGFLQTLLRFDTSNPPGQERQAIDWIASVLDAARVPYEIVALEEERPNLIATLAEPGEGARLLLSSHVDVVPVEDANSWKVPPFSATEADGCMWGRGALDMKYKTAYDLALLCHLKERYQKLPLKAVFLADEEADAVHGARFVVREHRELISADVVLNEVGAFNLSIAGQTFFPIQVGEKGHFHYRLHSHGMSGHASMPLPRSSIQVLARALTCLEDHFFGFAASAGAKAFLQGVAGALDGSARDLFTALEDPTRAEQVLQHIEDPILRVQIRSMLCHTVAATRIGGGFKLNVLPESAMCDLDCRIVPGVEQAHFTRLLQRFFDQALEMTGHAEMRDQLQLECVGGTSGYEISPHHSSVVQVMRRVASGWEDVGVRGTPVPMLLPASSDNTHYAGAGMVPIGCAPVFFPDEFPGFALAHGVNERIPLEGVRKGLAVYCKVVAALLELD